MSRWPPDLPGAALLRSGHHRLWPLVAEAIMRCEQVSAYNNSGIKSAGPTSPAAHQSPRVRHSPIRSGSPTARGQLVDGTAVTLWAQKLSFAFWPSDCGRRAAARKAPASAALRALGLAARPDHCTFASLAGRDLQCQKANKNGRPTPTTRKWEIMTGNLGTLHRSLVLLRGLSLTVMISALSEPFATTNHAHFTPSDGYPRHAVTPESPAPRGYPAQRGQRGYHCRNTLHH